MGLMNSALHIGRTALLSYQGALQTVGNNVSSAASPDYTRLQPQLSPLQGPVIAGDLQPGAGVALSGIQRNLDEALEDRLRTSIGDVQSATVRETTLARVETLFDDVSGAGVAERLREFFTSFDRLQNQPEELGNRDLAISAGVQLAESLQRLREQFSGIGEDLNSQIGDVVATADDLAQKISNLNEEITTMEASSRGQATGLRDQRDALLRQLSELFDVTVRHQPDGAINVYIGSEALVQGNFVRRIVAVDDMDGQFVRTSIRFEDTNGQVAVRGGRLHGLITSRDQDGYGQVASIDQLARAIIHDVNQIHADGQGLVSFQSLTGNYGALGSDLPLNDSSTGLPSSPGNGSFYVVVADNATATPVAHRIDVSFDDPAVPTTLESLVAQFNEQVTGVTASISAGNRLTITADDGFSFTFGHDGQEARVDTSGILAALGMNTFFEGIDARDIAVSELIQSEPRLLAAATTHHAGDGLNAGRVAALEISASDQLGGTSIREYHNALVTNVAVISAAAKDDQQAMSAVLSSLQSQKETISGVNLDEEAISLLKYERAFQGVSRYVSVVDGLIRDLVTLIQ